MRHSVSVPIAVRIGAALAGCSLLACAGSSTIGPKPAWELPAPVPEDRPVIEPGAVTRVDLRNGLRVLIHEDHRLPRVSLGLLVRRGAAVESPEEAGAVAYMAELMERGAGDRDALAFAEVVDALGASFQSGADWDSVGVGVSGLSRDLDLLLELLADAALRPRFDPREATRARDQVLSALERAKDDPATLVSWYASRALYGTHRFGLPVSGTPETVSGFDHETARAFHARLFVPNGALLSVSGDVEPDAVLAALRAHFGSWPRGEVVPPGAPPPDRAPPSRRVWVVDRPDLGQVQIAVGHEGISRTDEDRVAVSIFNLVIGGSGFSSRLMEALRTEEGLTYSVGSGYSLRRAPGPFLVSTFTRVEELRRALDILLAELARAREEPPGEDELAWARTLAAGRFALSLETSDSVTRSLADLDVYGLPEDSLDTYRGRVRAVTPEDVAAAARDHLDPDRAAIVLVGPAESIVPQLEGLGPVEVVQP